MKFVSFVNEVEADMAIILIGWGFGMVIDHQEGGLMTMGCGALALVLQSIRSRL